MTINQETVEITDKSMLFRELLENRYWQRKHKGSKALLAIQQVINLSKTPLLAEQSLTASYYQTQAKSIAVVFNYIV